MAQGAIDDTYTIHYGADVYTMAADAVTTDNLALLFGLDAQRIVLREQMGDRVLFPMNGSFNLTAQVAHTFQVVNRAPTQQPVPQFGQVFGQLQNRTRPPVPAPFVSSAPGTPQVGIPPPALRTNRVGRNSPIPPEPQQFKDLNIRKAVLDHKGKPQGIQNYSIRITRAEANTAAVNAKIKDTIGDGYVVCDKDGLPLPDALQYRDPELWGFDVGRAFNATRLYAMKAREIDSDEEEEMHFIPPSRASGAGVGKRKIDNDCKLLKKAQKIIETTADLENLKGTIDALTTVLTCSMCLKVLSEPIICLKCGRIVCCKGCREKWISTNNQNEGDPLADGNNENHRKCVICRERFDSDNDVMRVTGLDEVLAKLSQL